MVGVKVGEPGVIVPVVRDDELNDAMTDEVSDWIGDPLFICDVLILLVGDMVGVKVGDPGVIVYVNKDDRLYDPVTDELSV